MRRTQFFQLKKGRALSAGFGTGTQTLLREAVRASQLGAEIG